MAMVFQVRGTQLNAYYAKFCKEWAAASTLANTPTVVTDNSAGIFGSKYIQKASTGARGLIYAGFTNAPDSNVFAILWRIIPRWTGAPAAQEALMSIGGYSANGIMKLDFSLLTSGKLRFRQTGPDQAATSFDSTNAYTSYVSGTPVDLMVSWNGSTAANSFKWSVDGSEIDAFTVSTAAFTPTSPLVRPCISVGLTIDSARSNWDLNELVIYNTAETHTYSVRSDFISASNTEGYPAAADVRLGTSFPDPGSATNRTGTLVIPDSAAIADAVWDEATSGHTTAGTFGEKVGSKLLTTAKFLGLK